MKNYHITQDELFTNFINNRPGLSQSSITNYTYALQKFTEANQLTLTEIITNCKAQQNRIIEKIITRTTKDNEEIIEKERIEFDVNDPQSNIQQYIKQHITYCKNKGNTNQTINSNLDFITVILDYYNIQMPKIIKLPEEKKTWNQLTKQDIKFIIANSTLTHSSLISLLKSSGMRIKDATLLTIDDFMTGTSQYHNFTDVNEFIDHAPPGMICTFEFYPHKTKRHDIKCITFADPETCDLILQNLRRIKNEYLPRINKTKKLNLKMSKNDALFGNQRQNFKGHMTTHTVSDLFHKKNKLLHEHRINLIYERIKNNEISEEDFDKEAAKIPKFHAHALRKFFSSIIAKNCGNIRICAIMEGHTTPLKTDDSYIKLDVVEVKEAYMAALEDLSLEHVEVKVYTSEIRKEMEDKINKLQEEVKQKEKQSHNIEERLSKMERLFNSVDQMSDEEVLSLFAKRRNKQ